jgi:hypothetical protein
LTDTQRLLKVTHGISVKQEPGAKASKMEELMHHISTVNRVMSVGSFVCQAPGPIIASNGNRVLNTYHGNVIQPAEDDGIDRAFGEDFPYIWDLIRGLLDSPEQIDYLLAWFKRLYGSALYQQPTRGHNIMIMGPAGTGKSLLATQVFGAAVGGSVDASDFLLRNQTFGAELFDSTLWLVEDDSPAEDARVRARFHTKLKQMAANDGHRYSQKFLVPTQVDWFGRVAITANTDFTSATVIPPLDDSSGDKLCLFRAVKKHPLLHFGTRDENLTPVKEQLPFFLRAILKWTPGDHVKPEPNGERFGFVAYHNPSLLKLSHQVSDVGPFAQIVSDALRADFLVSPKKTEWNGTSTDVLRMVSLDPQNVVMLRGTTLRNFSRSMYNAAKAELFSLRFTLTEGESKEWSFYRPDDL